MKHGWNWASVYWLCWFAVGFIPFEFWQLAAGHPENTLSAQVWHLTGQGGSGQWTFGHFFTLIFCIWLLGHFAFGWWR